jgi:hypothetical protein
MYVRSGPRSLQISEKGGRDHASGGYLGMALRSELLLRGLPWNCTKAHVSLFLLSHGLDAREGEITMVDCRRRPSGRAIVHCQSNQAAMTAALAVHLKKFGGRYIEAYVHTEVGSTRFFVVRSA